MDGTPSHPLAQAMAAGTVARRLAARGDVHLALGLLCQALQLAPEAPLLSEAEIWLTADNLRGTGRRPLRRLAHAIAKLASKAPRGGAASHGRAVNLRAGARVLDRIRTCYPDEGKLYVSEAFVRAKLGDVAGKARVVRDAARFFPLNWDGHGVMVALASSTAD
jgi:hypothetical protein